MYEGPEMQLGPLVNRLFGVRSCSAVPLDEGCELAPGTKDLVCGLKAC